MEAFRVMAAIAGTGSPASLSPQTLLCSCCPECAARLRQQRWFQEPLPKTHPLARTRLLAIPRWQSHVELCMSLNFLTTPLCVNARGDRCRRVSKLSKYKNMSDGWDDR